ncbi:MAG: hypothetical protein ACYTDX_02355, partial [Planctomycetota bacterium]
MSLYALVPGESAAQDEEQDRIRVVALNGDDLDEFGPGESLTVYGSRDTLAIAANGDVLFDGAASDGQTLRPGWFHSDGSDVVGLLYRFETAPTPFEAFTVSTVQSALLGRDGNVGLELFLSGAPSTDALATWIDESLTYGAVAPGAFTDLLQGNRAFNGETLVFQGRVASEPVAPRFHTTTTGVWRRTGEAAAVPVIQQDNGVPGLAGRIVDSISSVPIVHESGATAFHVRLRTPGSERALLVYPPPGSSANPTVASVHEANDVVHDVTFGDPADGADLPRWAYLATKAG